MVRQVDKKAYKFDKYCDKDRWASYWNQINEIVKLNPVNVLEVGVGDNVFSSYIKNNTDIEYTSLDIAEDLRPDIVGDIKNIPIKNNFYNIVCAFEVLEHLSFEKFEETLRELSRVSNKYVIISLPHWGRHFSVDIRMPFLKRFKFKYKINLFPIRHKFRGQHYWEIGKKGYSLINIKKIIKKSGLKIKNNFIVFESPYHHFFILKK
jgi:ubiquinone/menaquinone biosynthesis C-methylase UbiE